MPRLEDIKEKIIQALLPYEPIRIGVFGSFARGEQKEGSDIDILVHFKEVPSLIDLVEAEENLENILGIEVDLVTEGGLKNPLIVDSVEEDLIVIFDANPNLIPKIQKVIKDMN